MAVPFRTACIAFVALPLAACASFSGMPDPVLDVRTATAIPANLQPAQAVAAFWNETDEGRRKALRNRVIAVYMAAMDARYAEFRRALAKEVRGGNLGLDVATLGVGGLGSLAKGSANELAALSAFLTGSRTSINKEIYFEQTLPALVATMDANRIKARGTILSHLQDSAQAYPIELAYADLANYELAASIDGAVQQLTSEAAKNLADEERRYAAVTASCGPTQEATDLRNRIMSKAYDFAGFDDPDAPPSEFAAGASTANLELVASTFLGSDEPRAETPAQAAEQIVKLSDAVTGICDPGRLRALIDKVNSDAGSPIL